LNTTTRAENTPNATKGIIGLIPVAKKDTAVVTEVISMALEAFLKV